MSEVACELENAEIRVLKAYLHCNACLANKVHFRCRVFFLSNQQEKVLREKT